MAHNPVIWKVCRRDSTGRAPRRTASRKPTVLPIGVLPRRDITPSTHSLPYNPPPTAFQNRRLVRSHLQSTSAIGSTRLGSLFLTVPTRVLTGQHVFIADCLFAVAWS